MAPANCADSADTILKSGKSYYSGCRDIDWREHYRGHGTVEIDVATGTVQIQTEAQHVPDPHDVPILDDESAPTARRYESP